MKNDYFKTDAQGNAYAGDHILLDLHGAKDLDDPRFLQHTIEQAARYAGATVIGSNYKVFGNGGVSGCTILAESHISIHTWPERGFAAVDVFMCGDTEPLMAAEHIGYALGAKTRNIRHEKRGTDPDRKQWGQHLVLDLKGCEDYCVKSASHIHEWCLELVVAINMKPFGNTIIHHFGKGQHETEGFTLIQLIETSSITAHFAENIGEAYIDIFSCKPFDEKIAMKVCQKYFKPKIIETKNLKRG